MLEVLLSPGWLYWVWEGDWRGKTSHHGAFLGNIWFSFEEGTVLNRMSRLYKTLLESKFKHVVVRNVITGQATSKWWWRINFFFHIIAPLFVFLADIPACGDSNSILSSYNIALLSLRTAFTLVGEVQSDWSWASRQTSQSCLQLTDWRFPLW